MTQPNEILTQFDALRADNPNMRTLDAAQKIGTSEGALTAARVGRDVVRLRPEPIEILSALEPLGEVMALTRNPHCVHERKGIYQGAQFERHGPMTIGLFVNPDIDLRLFMSHWAFCFAVSESGANNTTRKSLQFFDKEGIAVHKIYATDATDTTAYDAVVAQFRDAEQSTALASEAYPAPKPFANDAEVDWQAFRTAWEGLQDTHDFVPMIRKFNVSREQAFAHIGSDFAYPIALDAPRQVLDLAAEKQCEIMVFVGNRGCIQIHTGGVEKLKAAGEWYNVLDPKFNLHLREGGVHSAWVTRKPTEDGIVTAVEVFDATGELIATFFGKRKPGIPELELWREIVAELAPLNRHAKAS